MKLITFLLLLVDLGKGEGGIKGAAEWVISIKDQVTASLPDGVTDALGPTVDRLFTELGGAVDKLSLKAVLEEMIAFAETLKNGLGPPDSRAGVGV